MKLSHLKVLMTSIVSTTALMVCIQANATKAQIPKLCTEYTFDSIDIVSQTAAPFMLIVMASGGKVYTNRGFPKLVEATMQNPMFQGQYSCKNCKVPIDITNHPESVPLTDFKIGQNKAYTCPSNPQKTAPFPEVCGNSQNVMSFNASCATPP